MIHSEVEVIVVNEIIAELTGEKESNEYLLIQMSRSIQLPYPPTDGLTLIFHIDNLLTPNAFIDLADALSRVEIFNVAYDTAEECYIVQAGFGMFDEEDAQPHITINDHLSAINELIGWIQTMGWDVEDSCRIQRHLISSGYWHVLYKN